MTPHEGNPSSLSCELTIIKARNIDHMKLSGGAIFVRCYLYAGNKTRVALNSREILIPSRSSDTTITNWNQTFSLECSGNQESIRRLKQETLVFELRWRSKSAPFISRLIQGSRLIGRAEIPWSEVHDKTKVEIEKWVVMIPHDINYDGRVHDDGAMIKPPAVQIVMKIHESDFEVINRKEIDGGRCDEGCGYGGCNSCVDYEFFAIEAALEAMV